MIRLIMNDRGRMENYRHHLTHLLEQAKARDSDGNIYVQATFPAYVIGYLEAMFEMEEPVKDPVVKGEDL